MTITSLNVVLTGSQAVNAAWSAPAGVSITKEISDVVITLSVDSKVVIEFTYDGTNYYTINEGDKIEADSIYIIEVKLLQADVFNIRTPTVGGCNINICRVQESAAVIT